MSQDAQRFRPSTPWRAPRLGAALLLLLSLAPAATGCDAAADFCAASDEVSADRWVQCDKSCSKGNQTSCAREIDVGKRLCHEKFSVYHCMRSCSAGDEVACQRAKAAMR
jgi:hypothetical protein